MSLTQFAIAKALPKDKPYKLTDSGGLHLLVRPNGSKLWHLRYRFNGQENTLAIGVFPATSLASARTKREEARALIATGMNPSVKRKLDKIAAATAARNTFGDIAEEHLENMAANGIAATTMIKLDERLMRIKDLIETKERVDAELEESIGGSPTRIQH